MKKLLGMALLVAMTAAVSPVMAGEAAYKALHAEAVAAADKARKVNGEWRDIRWKKSTVVKVDGKKMAYLSAAEAYAKKGDYKNAMKYAEIAKFQGEMGYTQAVEQKNAGPRH